MFCTQCGNEIPDGAAACPSCGRVIAPQQQPAPPPEAAQPQMPPSQARPQPTPEPQEWDASRKPWQIQAVAVLFILNGLLDILWGLVWAIAGSAVVAPLCTGLLCSLFGLFEIIAAIGLLLKPTKVFVSPYLLAVLEILNIVNLGCVSFAVGIANLVLLANPRSRAHLRSVNQRKCPNCGAPLPAFRAPKTTGQALLGGWTCPNCGAELNRSGRMVKAPATAVPTAGVQAAVPVQPITEPPAPPQPPAGMVSPSVETGTLQPLIVASEEAPAQPVETVPVAAEPPVVKSANDWCAEGNTLGSMGKHEEARACLEKALAADPTHALAWFNMGLTLMNLGQKEEAIRAFESFLRYAPPEAQALHVPVAQGYIQELRGGESGPIGIAQ